MGSIHYSLPNCLLLQCRPFSRGKPGEVPYGVTPAEADPGITVFEASDTCCVRNAFAPFGASAGIGGSVGVGRRTVSYPHIRIGYVVGKRNATLISSHESRETGVFDYARTPSHQFKSSAFAYGGAVFYSRIKP